MNASKPLFVELSDLELEAVAGGKDNDLVDVDVVGNEIVKNTNVSVSLNALNDKPSQVTNFPLVQQ